MHPEDAAALHLHDNQRVQVRSRRGQSLSVLKIDDDIAPGVIFMPMHWNDLWAPNASPNEVTTDATDPISHQPALKCCSVSVSAYTTFDAAEASNAAPIPKRSFSPA
jgi:ferredoxin-nitrate reductase